MSTYICLPTPTCFITFSRMLGRISLLENIVLMVGSTAFIATACRAMRSAWKPIKEEGRGKMKEGRGKREDIVLVTVCYEFVHSFGATV